jgi:aryl-alcohol dehydrogenase-like predicted oxidoreductase
LDPIVSFFALLLPRELQPSAQKKIGSNTSLPCPTHAHAAKIKEIAAEVEGASMAAVSLAWALAQPGVVAVVVGASKPEQATRNAEAASIKVCGKRKQPRQSQALAVFGRCDLPLCLFLS